ncbi:tripartite tricarboxylate transporter TctB family protein [Thauera mechernichensis]|uniref:Tripartite tricarboxylate transporter TctB family protein n=1 Tax=Thauera mechernichensis TaxID=82788 RepID=A0ABW3WKF8_9RHOO|nr:MULTISPECIES: tripartite tricarboxylate transporter TctB family protein [Thauera]ENO82868.1 TctB protein [Thauera sp. 27]MDG3065296.1 tripartite tricarboxylate transporter TctB family protein [Thauera mechernichensis]
MSERIFGGVLVLISLVGLFIARGFEAPFSYEPVGPKAFPMIVLALLGLFALALVFGKTEKTAWAPGPVMQRIGLLFLVVLGYALLFDRLGFVIATALVTLPVARLFGASWKQALVSGVGLGIGLFYFFDRLLDVALPTGLWLNAITG